MRSLDPRSPSINRLALVPLLATAAVAAHAQTFLDNARVTSVDPQYDNVRVPRQECSNRLITEPRGNGEREYGGPSSAVWRVL